MSIKAYKGFNRDMTCNGFQYKEGETYEIDRAKTCVCGFHACVSPLDCLSYYPPNESVYHEVELDGDIATGCDDSKVAATKIKVGARLTIEEMIKAAVEFTRREGSPTTTTGQYAHAVTTGDFAHAATTGHYARAATTGDCAHAATTGDCAHAATTGHYARAATTGYRARAATTGDCTHAATTGDCAHAATTGDFAHAATTGHYARAATTGDCAHAATTGDCAHAATTGQYAHAATTGDCAHAATTGDYAKAEVKGDESIAVVTGRNCHARGGKGSWLVLTERNSNNHIAGIKAIKMDGKKYKPDTWYALKNGRVVEVGQ